MRIALTEWLGIRGLDSAVPLAVLSGAIVLCWSLPSAIIPIEALRHLGDAQKVSVLFFVVSLIGVAAAICVPLIVRRVGRRIFVAMGVAITVLSAATLAIESTLPLIAGTALRILGFLCIDIVLEIIIMERIPRRSLARFEAVRMFCMGFGLILGPWLGVWLLNRLAFWSPFVLLSGVNRRSRSLHFLLASRVESRGSTGAARSTQPVSLHSTILPAAETTTRMAARPRPVRVVDDVFHLQPDLLCPGRAG